MMLIPGLKRVLQAVALCLLIMSTCAVSTLAGSSEAGYRYEFDDIKDWLDMPSWNARPALDYVSESVTVDNGTAIGFLVGDTKSAMKWKMELSGVDAVNSPYFTVRYKGDGIPPDQDYVIWFAGEDQVRIFLKDFILDGQWHETTFNLSEMMIKPEKLVRIIVQVTTQSKPGSLTIDWIEFSGDSTR